jgi:hypothetical protein
LAVEEDNGGRAKMAGVVEGAAVKVVQFEVVGWAEEGGKGG